MTKSLVMLVAAVSLLAACATPPSTTSGFLDDYSSLASKDETSDLVKSRAVPSGQLATYTHVHMEPVRILVTNLDEKQSDAVQSAMEDALETEMLKHWLLSEAEGEGVLRVRVAVTDLHKPNVALNVLTTAVLMPVDYGTLTIESEVLDSLSGESLAALVWAKRSGLKQTFQTFTPTGSSRALAPYFARDLVELLGRGETANDDIEQSESE
jgi:hypothetical protein